MIHFLRPEWLLALFPLALLLWFARRSQYQVSSWNRYIAPHLAKVLVSSQTQSGKRHLHVIGFSWCIAVLALSGPAFTKQTLPVFETNQGRVIVMDMSLSMYATDLVPNRLTQAKFKANDLITSLTEGETGLIAYAGDAFTISPLTRDRATLLNLLPTLSPEIMPVPGSNLPAALTQATTLLKQGGHLRGDIILLTDGVAVEQINQAKAHLQGSQYRLSVLAFGSPQGAAIRLPDGQLMRDRSDQVVVAKTDYQHLSELASANGGKVFTYRADGSDLSALNLWLAQSTATKASDLEGELWLDAGPYIALLLLLPALLSFRHAIAALSCIILFSQPTPAFANSWLHPWQTDNQRAMQAYENQDYQQAASLFSDPNWQAAARYREGDYQQALKLFEQDTTATGFYNQGNSLMQLQDYPAAIERYQQALAQDNDFSDAQHNLALAQQLLAQQQTDSEQQSQSEQNQDTQQQAESDNNQQQADGESGDKQPDEPDSNQQQGNDKSGDKQSASEQSQPPSAQQPSEPSSQPDNTPSTGDDEPNNEAPMSAQAPKPGENDEQAQPDQAQARSDTSANENDSSNAAEALNEDSNKDPNDHTQAQAVSQSPPPEELPADMQRALSGVLDDPQVLLRNKMLLEYEKRRRQGTTPKESEQW